MKHPLATYIHDHLAGASYALDLVAALRDHFKSDPLGQFAATLHTEIAADKGILHRIAEQFGPTSDPLKDGAAWITEKVSKIKLSPSDPSGLGTFEALEFLAIGIHGKLLLWRALSEISREQSQLIGIDFAQLMSRAQSQEESVNTWRLDVARMALVMPSEAAAQR